MTFEELDELQSRYDKGDRQAIREVEKIMVEAGVMVDDKT